MIVTGWSMHGVGGGDGIVGGCGNGNGRGCGGGGDGGGGYGWIGGRGCMHDESGMKEWMRRKESLYKVDVRFDSIRLRSVCVCVCVN